MGNSKKVITVVVTYNRKKLLLECIKRLLDQKTDALLDILVIDNASSDGTKDAIQNFVDNGTIRYINTGANLGGAGGFEKGVREAAKDDYDYIWIMDDDTLAENDSLERLISSLSM